MKKIMMMNDDIDDDDDDGDAQKWHQNAIIFWLGVGVVDMSLVI